MTELESFNRKWMIEPFSGCWLWLGALLANGRYGHFRTQSAHRAAWKLYNGVIPDGMNVCHKCDTGICVNPAHLFLGTQSDNVADCGAKGRSNKAGEINGNAKLSHTDVLAIRNSQCGSDKLAKTYGVTRQTIWSIKTRDTWRDA